jgi:hypothetical protein
MGKVRGGRSDEMAVHCTHTTKLRVTERYRPPGWYFFLTFGSCAFNVSTHISLSIRRS